MGFVYDGQRWDANARREALALAFWEAATTKGPLSDESRQCGQSLIEIDNRGDPLVGCLTCNLWADSEDARWIRLSEEDLRALHQLRHGGSR
jgi:hypothetical protein